MLIFSFPKNEVERMFKKCTRKIYIFSDFFHSPSNGKDRS